MPFDFDDNENCGDGDDQHGKRLDYFLNSQLTQFKEAVERENLCGQCAVREYGIMLLGFFVFSEARIIKDEFIDGDPVLRSLVLSIGKEAAAEATMHTVAHAAAKDMMDHIFATYKQLYEMRIKADGGSNDKGS